MLKNCTIGPCRLPLDCYDYQSNCGAENDNEVYERENTCGSMATWDSLRKRGSGAKTSEQTRHHHHEHHQNHYHEHHHHRARMIRIRIKLAKILIIIINAARWTNGCKSVVSIQTIKLSDTL